MIRTLAFAILMLLATPLVLHAQGDVRGVLFDSLRTLEPIGNAFVTVDGRPERARTDRRGRFRFTTLPQGIWTLRYQAPWLDSLALPPITVQVEVPAGGATVGVVMSTPSLFRMQYALCGAALDEDAGMLLGMVRDARGAPLVGLFVGAIWAEAAVATRGVTNTLVGTVDTTGTGGEFALCGVPRGTTFMVRVGNQDFGTEELVLALDGYPMRHLELVAGAASGAGSVTGRVVGEGGRGIPAPTLSVPGDSVRGARGDDQGRFVVDGLAPRSTQLFIRAIGHLPRYVLLNPALGPLDLGEFALAPVAQELAARRVTARATSLAELEFRQREQTGNGIFVDEERLKQYPVLSATALANESIRIRSTGGNFPQTLIRRGADTCRPRFFLDGVDWGIARDGLDEKEIFLNAKRVEIYEAAFMPARFTDFNGCGVILVWTR